MQTLLPRLSSVTSHGLAFLAILALLVTVTSGAVAQTPMVLPPLDGHIESSAFGINARGEVVGFSRGNGLMATVWDRSGTPRALPPVSFQDFSSAFAINARGEVVGSSTSGVSGTATMWDRSGAPTALPPPPSLVGEDCMSSSARGINARGQVVGQCFGFDRDTAILWDRSGSPMVLPPLDGDTSSSATAINARGEVAGTSSVNGGSTAVVWDRSGAPRVLQPLDGDTNSAAFGINARGEVAGWSSQTPFFGETAVVWDRSGTPRALQSFDIEFSLDAVNGINARGEVVGVVLDLGVGTPPETVEVAVVWDRSGTPIKLPPPDGAFHAVANAINARGEIAGFFFTFDFDGGEGPFPPVLAMVWR